MEWGTPVTVSTQSDHSDSGTNIFASDSRHHGGWSSHNSSHPAQSQNSREQGYAESPIPYRSAYVGPAVQLSHVPFVPGAAWHNDPQVRGEVDRGRSLDFYAIRDPLLLASWASFFRDQYIMTQKELDRAKYDRTSEVYRQVSSFLQRVQTHVLKTEEMETVFRRSPFSSDLVSL
jgi:hypothetical protein